MRALLCGLATVVFASITMAESRVENLSGHFKSGNEFQVTAYRGTVKIRCVDGAHNIKRKFKCYDEILAPAPQDVFVSVAGTAARQVQLSIVRDDGSKYSKTYSYNGVTGESGLLNLWYGILPQPLLKIGTNSIDFTLLKKDGSAVGSGHFNALVKEASPVTCMDQTYESDSIHDCEDEFITCRRYFALAIANDKCY